MDARPPKTGPFRGTRRHDLPLSPLRPCGNYGIICLEPRHARGVSAFTARAGHRRRPAFAAFSAGPRKARGNDVAIAPKVHPTCGKSPPDVRQNRLPLPSARCDSGRGKVDWCGARRDFPSAVPQFGVRAARRRVKMPFRPSRPLAPAGGRVVSPVERQAKGCGPRFGCLSFARASRLVARETRREARVDEFDGCETCTGRRRGQVW
jgi:hypothetical protein